MNEITAHATPADATTRAAMTPQVDRQSSAAPQPAAATNAGADADGLQGLSLVDASATIGSGRNLVADYVMGAGNQLAQIRVIDPTTHQVVAVSPPDSIARMQQEIFAYQGVASQSRGAADK